MIQGMREGCKLHHFNYIIIFYEIAVFDITYSITVFRDKIMAKVVMNDSVLRKKSFELQIMDRKLRWIKRVIIDNNIHIDVG